MRSIVLTISAIGVLAVATPSQAELVFFSSGRTMSVKGHRVEGDAVVLMLRGGGEIVCDGSVVARIAPDEVPYPEDTPAPPPTPPPASVASDSTPFSSIIDRVAAEHGVEPKLARAVIQVESGYQERARSPKGAMGLMQLMPATARRYAVADPYDPVTNIEAGIAHLKSLLDRFPTALALAAYNAGEAAVVRFHGIPPYPETRDYVSRILELVGR
jgi:soluble lytic murein transglycosylase-like protein